VIDSERAIAIVAKGSRDPGRAGDSFWVKAAVCDGVRRLLP
jgi:hypothetical protein